MKTSLHPDRESQRVVLGLEGGDLVKNIPHKHVSDSRDNRGSQAGPEAQSQCNELSTTLPQTRVGMGPQKSQGQKRGMEK